MPFLCSACPSAKAENDCETENLMLIIQYKRVVVSFLFFVGWGRGEVGGSGPLPSVYI